MELYTMDRNFFKVKTIDAFNLAIWTERYKGDGDFKLNVPATADLVSSLPKGQLMMCEGSIQPMILESRTIKNGELEVAGITLTQWLNNRIVRSSAAADTRAWLLSGYTPGVALQQIVGDFCIASSFVGGTSMGIPAAVSALFAVPGLANGAYDASGSVVDLSVPFGGVYDALKQIADAYDIGMRIDLMGVYPDHFVLNYITFKGANRTSSQNTNKVVRFSPEMESFTNIQDLESIADYKNLVLAVAPQTAALLSTVPYATSAPLPAGPSFDLRVEQYFDEETTTDSVSNDASKLTSVLNQKAAMELASHSIVSLIDGEIVQTGQIEYGRDYFLGDTVEVQGNTGVLQSARVTEYIRSQDATGERAYPTLAMS